MSGIVQQAGGGQITPQGLQQHFKVPPQFHEAYTRTCAAGMKILFDKNTHDMVAQYLQKPGDTGMKIGSGIASVVLYVYKQSNQTLPPQVLVPAGLYLVAQALDYVKKTNSLPVTPQDEGKAMQAMLGIVLQKFHIDPDKMLSTIDQHGGKPPMAGKKPAAAPVGV
jgi:hypothetical protein